MNAVCLESFKVFEFPRRKVEPAGYGSGWLYLRNHAAPCAGTSRYDLRFSANKRDHRDRSFRRLNLSSLPTW